MAIHSRQVVEAASKAADLAAPIFESQDWKIKVGTKKYVLPTADQLFRLLLKKGQDVITEGLATGEDASVSSAHFRVVYLADLDVVEFDIILSAVVG